MAKRLSLKIRIVSSWVAFHFLLYSLFPSSFLNHSSAMAAPEISTSYASPESSLFSLPNTSGTVQNYQEGSNPANFVIHIQDAHANPEAQRSIRDILHWIDDYAAKGNREVWVGLEGAEGNLRTDFLDFSKQPSVNEAILKDLLAKGELTGSEWYAWEKNQELKKEGAGADSLRRTHFVGVETPDLYRENLKTYREMVYEKESVARLLAPIQARLEIAESKIFSPELRDFIKEKTRRKEGDFGLGGNAATAQFSIYLIFLSGQAKEKLGIDLSEPIEQVRFPNLFRILKLDQLEKKMDSAKVKSQAALLRQRLTDPGTSRPRNAEFQKILNLEAVPEMRRAAVDFFKAVKPQESWNEFPDFLEWMAHSILISEISAGSLLAETEHLENALMEKLAKTNSEKRLTVLVRDVSQLEKLLNLVMTRDEFSRLEPRIQELQPDKLMQAIEKENPSAPNRPAAGESTGNGMPDLFLEAIHFYETVKKRDKALVENTLSLAPPEDLKILITGGFHTEGLIAVMEEKNVGFAVIRPSMSKTPEAHLSQEVFQDKHADTQNLFGGQFLSKQEALFLKEILGPGAKALWQTGGIKPAELPAQLADIINHHPVLSNAVQAKVSEDGGIRLELSLKKAGTQPIQASGSASEEMSGTGLSGVVDTLISGQGYELLRAPVSAFDQKSIPMDASLVFEVHGEELDFSVTQKKLTDAEIRDFEARRSEMRMTDPELLNLRYQNVIQAFQHLNGAIPAPNSFQPQAQKTAAARIYQQWILDFSTAVTPFLNSVRELVPGGANLEDVDKDELLSRLKKLRSELNDELQVLNQQSEAYRTSHNLLFEYPMIREIRDRAAEFFRSLARLAPEEAAELTSAPAAPEILPQSATPEEQMARAYWEGKLQTSPIPFDFRASREDDVVRIGALSTDEQVRLARLAFGSLINGDGYVSKLVAGASSRMNPAEAPADVLALIQGRELKSKAAVPFGVAADGSVINYLGLAAESFSKLLREAAEEAERLGLPNRTGNNIFGLMSNEAYREEHETLLSQGNHFGLDPAQVRFFLQPLGPKFIATVKDVEAYKAAGKFKTDVAYQQALAIAQQAEVEGFQTGQSDKLILESERDPWGHGEYFHQLIESGELLTLIDSGKKWIHVSNIDNAGAKYDWVWLVTLGLFLDRGLDFQGEVSPRLPWQGGGALIVRTDNNGKVLAEDPNIRKTNEARGKVVMQPKDSYWFNDGVGFASMHYVMDLYKKRDEAGSVMQSDEEFLEEYRKADAAGRRAIAQRGRIRFPVILDGKPAKQGGALVEKPETNLWQSTNVVSPDLKVDMVGVEGIGNLDIAQFLAGGWEQQREALRGMRFMSAKRWEDPESAVRQLVEERSRLLGREVSMDEILPTLETYKGNKPIAELILRYNREVPAIPPGVFARSEMRSRDLFANLQLETLESRVSPVTRLKFPVTTLPAGQIGQPYFDSFKLSPAQQGGRISKIGNYQYYVNYDVGPKTLHGFYSFSMQYDDFGTPVVETGSLAGRKILQVWVVVPAAYRPGLRMALEIEDKFKRKVVRRLTAQEIAGTIPLRVNLPAVAQRLDITQVAFVNLTVQSSLRRTAAFNVFVGGVRSKPPVTPPVPGPLNFPVISSVDESTPLTDFTNRSIPTRVSILKLQPSQVTVVGEPDIQDGSAAYNYNLASGKEGEKWAGVLARLRDHVLNLEEEAFVFDLEGSGPKAIVEITDAAGIKLSFAVDISSSKKRFALTADLIRAHYPLSSFNLKELRDVAFVTDDRAAGSFTAQGTLKASIKGILHHEPPNPFAVENANAGLTDFSSLDPQPVIIQPDGVETLTSYDSSVDNEFTFAYDLSRGTAAYPSYFAGAGASLSSVFNLHDGPIVLGLDATGTENLIIEIQDINGRSVKFSALVTDQEQKIEISDSLFQQFNVTGAYDDKIAGIFIIVDDASSSKTASGSVHVHWLGIHGPAIRSEMRMTEAEANRIVYPSDDVTPSYGTFVYEAREKSTPAQVLEAIRVLSGILREDAAVFKVNGTPFPYQMRGGEIAAGQRIEVEFKNPNLAHQMDVLFGYGDVVLAMKVFRTFTETARLRINTDKAASDREIFRQGFIKGIQFFDGLRKSERDIFAEMKDFIRVFESATLNYMKAWPEEWYETEQVRSLAIAFSQFGTILRYSDLYKETVAVLGRYYGKTKIPNVFILVHLNKAHDDLMNEAEISGRDVEARRHALDSLRYLSLALRQSDPRNQLQLNRNLENILEKTSRVTVNRVVAGAEDAAQPKQARESEQGLYDFVGAVKEFAAFHPRLGEEYTTHLVPALNAAAAHWIRGQGYRIAKEAAEMATSWKLEDYGERNLRRIADAEGQPDRSDELLAPWQEPAAPAPLPEVRRSAREKAPASFDKTAAAQILAAILGGHKDHAREKMDEDAWGTFISEQQEAFEKLKIDAVDGDLNGQFYEILYVDSNDTARLQALAGEMSDRIAAARSEMRTDVPTSQAAGVTAEERLRLLENSQRRGRWLLGILGITSLGSLTLSGLLSWYLLTRVPSEVSKEPVIVERTIRQEIPVKVREIVIREVPVPVKEGEVPAPVKELTTEDIQKLSLPEIRERRSLTPYTVASPGFRHVQLTAAQRRDYSKFAKSYEKIAELMGSVSGGAYDPDALNPEDLYAQIFEPFFAVKRSIKDRGKFLKLFIWAWNREIQFMNEEINNYYGNLGVDPAQVLKASDGRSHILQTEKRANAFKTFFPAGTLKWHTQRWKNTEGAKQGLARGYQIDFGQIGGGALQLAIGRYFDERAETRKTPVGIWDQQMESMILMPPGRNENSVPARISTAERNQKKYAEEVNLWGTGLSHSVYRSRIREIAMEGLKKMPPAASFSPDIELPPDAKQTENMNAIWEAWTREWENARTKVAEPDRARAALTTYFETAWKQAEWASVAVKFEDFIVSNRDLWANPNGNTYQDIFGKGSNLVRLQSGFISIWEKDGEKRSLGLEALRKLYQKEYGDFLLDHMEKHVNGTISVTLTVIPEAKKNWYSHRTRLADDRSLDYVIEMAKALRTLYPKLSAERKTELLEPLKDFERALADYRADSSEEKKMHLYAAGGLLYKRGDDLIVSDMFGLTLGTLREAVLGNNALLKGDEGKNNTAFNDFLVSKAALREAEESFYGRNLNLLISEDAGLLSADASSGLRALDLRIAQRSDVEAEARQIFKSLTGLEPVVQGRFGRSAEKPLEAMILKFWAKELGDVELWKSILLDAEKRKELLDLASRWRTYFTENNQPIVEEDLRSMRAGNDALGYILSKMRGFEAHAAKQLQILKRQLEREKKNDQEITAAVQGKRNELWSEWVAIEKKGLAQQAPSAARSEMRAQPLENLLPIVKNIMGLFKTSERKSALRQLRELGRNNWATVPGLVQKLLEEQSQLAAENGVDREDIEMAVRSLEGRNIAVLGGKRPNYSAGAVLSDKGGHLVNLWGNGAGQSSKFAGTYALHPGTTLTQEDVNNILRDHETIIFSPEVYEGTTYESYKKQLNDWGLMFGKALKILREEERARGVQTPAHKVFVVRAWVEAEFTNELFNLIKWERKPSAAEGKNDFYFDVVFQPDFSYLDETGQLVEDQVVYGLRSSEGAEPGSVSSENERIARTRETLNKLYQLQGLKDTKPRFIDVSSAELVKDAVIVYFASKLLHFNDMAELAVRFGADLNAIAYISGLDKRILKYFANPSSGFGSKMLQILEWMRDERVQRASQELKTTSRQIERELKDAQKQMQREIKRVRKAGSELDKKIDVYGKILEELPPELHYLFWLDNLLLSNQGTKNDFFKKIRKEIGKRKGKLTGVKVAVIGLDHGQGRVLDLISQFLEADAKDFVIAETDPEQRAFLTLWIEKVRESAGKDENDPFFEKFPFVKPYRNLADKLKYATFEFKELTQAVSESSLAVIGRASQPELQSISLESLSGALNGKPLFDTVNGFAGIRPYGTTPHTFGDLRDHKINYISVGRPSLRDASAPVQPRHELDDSRVFNSIADVESYLINLEEDSMRRAALQEAFQTEDPDLKRQKTEALLSKNVGVIGAVGYVGSVTSAYFPAFGHHVEGVDIKEKQKVVDDMNLPEPILHISEEGLSERIKAARGRLNFSTDAEPAIEKSSIVYVTVGTPSKDNGKIDPRYILQAVTRIADVIQRDKKFRTIVIKSTLTPDIYEQIMLHLYKQKGLILGLDYGLVSNPEFLRQGTAVEDVENPDRTGLGIWTPSPDLLELLTAPEIERLKSSLDEYRKRVQKQMLELFYGALLKKPHTFVLTGGASASLSKYAANGYLAVAITLANLLAEDTQLAGANYQQIEEVLRAFTRIGERANLMPGCGYGGSCFPKDVRALYNMSILKAGPPLRQMILADEENYRFKILAIDDLVEALSEHPEAVDALEEKTIALWGMSFNPKTDDVRESPAGDVVSLLLSKGVHQIRIYDPTSLDPNVGPGQRSRFINDELFKHLKESASFKRGFKKFIRSNGDEEPSFKRNLFKSLRLDSEFRGLLIKKFSGNTGQFDAYLNPDPTQQMDPYADGQQGNAVAIILRNFVDEALAKKSLDEDLLKAVYYRSIFFKEEFLDTGRVVFVDSLDETVTPNTDKKWRRSDAIYIVTRWDDFRRADFAKLVVPGKRLPVIDPRNALYLREKQDSLPKEVDLIGFGRLQKKRSEMRTQTESRFSSALQNLYTASGTEKFRRALQELLIPGNMAARLMPALLGRYSELAADEEASRLLNLPLSPSLQAAVPSRAYWRYVQLRFNAGGAVSPNRALQAVLSVLGPNHPILVAENTASIHLILAWDKEELPADLAAFLASSKEGDKLTFVTPFSEKEAQEKLVKIRKEARRYGISERILNDFQIHGTGSVSAQINEVKRIAGSDQMHHVSVIHDSMEFLEEKIGYLGAKERHYRDKALSEDLSLWVSRYLLRSQPPDNYTVIRDIFKEAESKFDFKNLSAQLAKAMAALRYIATQA